jgi:hypothetical protein
MALGVPILDIGAFGERIYPGVVTGLGAEDMFTLADLATWAESFFTAAEAGDGYFSFCGVYSGKANNFEDVLAGNPVVFGKLNHGDKFGGIGRNNVFFVLA